MLWLRSRRILTFHRLPVSHRYGLKLKPTKISSLKLSKTCCKSDSQHDFLLWSKVFTSKQKRELNRKPFVWIDSADSLSFSLSKSNSVRFDLLNNSSFILKSKDLERKKGKWCATRLIIFTLSVTRLQLCNCLFSLVEKGKQCMFVMIWFSCDCHVCV